jgi:hypothetical protein
MLLRESPVPAAVVPEKSLHFMEMISNAVRFAGPMAILRCRILEFRPGRTSRFSIRSQ